LNFKAIAEEYEDFNFIVETTIGKYVLKIFSDSREPGEVSRLVSIYEKVFENGISIPKLYKTDGSILYSDSGMNMTLSQTICAER
jgi:Ser/Thr protein kinase RdoA (MazF antagonist)